MKELPSHLAHLSIRTASNNDEQRITDLIFAVLREFGLHPSPETTDADLYDIEANYLKPGGSFELVEDGEKLLGTTGLFPLDDSVCELRKMYLIPSSRGCGLGKYLLERTVEHAKQLGFRRMVLETSSKLPAAIEFYKSFGFTEIPLEHPSPRADQAYAIDLN